jgi:hypothetical protein
MLDEILDNAVATSELLSQDLETSLNSKTSGYSSSTNYAATAADRARLSRSTTLGYLLPQPKNHGKIKRPELSQSNVDPDLLHKLEEQNNLLPPQVRPFDYVFCIVIVVRWMGQPTHMKRLDCVLTRKNIKCVIRTRHRSCWLGWKGKMNCLTQIPRLSVSSPMSSRVTSAHSSASLPIQQHSTAPTRLQLTLSQQVPSSWSHRKEMKRLTGSFGECWSRTTMQLHASCLICWQHACAKDSPPSSAD